MRNIALKVSIWFCTVIFTGCTSCEESDVITIANNSPKTLGFYFDTSQIIRPYAESPFEGSYVLLVEPYSRRNHHAPIREGFKHTTIQRLFLFDKALSDSITWDSLRANNLYAKRIDFTLKTLDSLHWTLTYP